MTHHPGPMEIFIGCYLTVYPVLMFFVAFILMWRRRLGLPAWRRPHHTHGGSR